MDAQTLAVELWEEAWGPGKDSAPWSKVLEGLTPQQAAWQPAPGRHSIWQNILHVAFWREVVLRRARGETISGENAREEVKRRNWEVVRDSSSAAFDALKDMWERSTREFIAEVRSGKVDSRRALQLLQHDQYHAGQIMHLRALQGLPPIE